MIVLSPHLYPGFRNITIKYLLFRCRSEILRPSTLLFAGTLGARPRSWFLTMHRAVARIPAMRRPQSEWYVSEIILFVGQTCLYMFCCRPDRPNCRKSHGGSLISHSGESQSTRSSETPRSTYEMKLGCQADGCCVWVDDAAGKECGGRVSFFHW